MRIFLRSNRANQEDGNATDFDAVFPQSPEKSWKNRKSNAVTTEMTAEIVKLGI